MGTLKPFVLATNAGLADTTHAVCSRHAETPLLI